MATKKEDFEKFKNDLIEEINKVRTDPRTYVPIMDKYINNFKDKNTFVKPGTGVDGVEEVLLETVEGKQGFKDAKKYLESQRPVGKLNYDEHLSKASKKFAKELGDAAVETPPESNPHVDTYIDYDKFKNHVLTIVDLGSTTAEELLTFQILDEGNPKKTHRKALFNKIVKYFGVGVAPHKSDYEVVTVLDFAEKINNYKEVEDSEEEETEKKPKEVDEQNPEDNEEKPDVKITVKEDQEEIEEDDENVKNKKDVPKTNATNDQKLNEHELSPEEKKLPYKEDPEAPKGAYKCRIREYVTKKGDKVLRKRIVKTYFYEDGTTEDKETTEDME